MQEVELLAESALHRKHLTAVQSGQSGARPLAVLASLLISHDTL